MAGIVADSTVLIDVLRGVPEAVAWLDEQDEQPTCSDITRVEIIRGLRSHERVHAEALFAGFDWLSVVEPIARLAGEFGRQFRLSHEGISVADLVIAATAELLGARVATHNVKHFPMFPGLRRPY